MSDGCQRIAFDVAYFTSQGGNPPVFSHQYREEWAPADLFCPKCGQRQVWQADNGGDFYVGDLHLCTACRSGFYLPGEVLNATNEQDLQRLTALTGPAPEALEGEAWYDAELAPALLELGRQCTDRGVSFIASVEYQPGERGGTYFLTEDAGLEMRMLHLAAMTAPNVDAYIINLARRCAELGIDTSASMVLQRLTKP